MRQASYVIIGGFVALTMSACTNPLSFGRGRFKVALEDVQLQRVPQATLFPPGRFERAPDRDRETMLIRFSSSIDLFEYFASWQRMIQVRCYVEGAANRRTYSSFGLGPYERGVDISRLRRGDTGPPPSGNDGRHLYSTYAFIDLVAHDEVYEDGVPRSELHLDKDRWSRISCYVIGVTKAPVLFP